MNDGKMILPTYFAILLSVLAKYALSETDREYLFMNGPCLNHEYRCFNDKCISRDKFCNKVDDCGDNSDEDYCYNHERCAPIYEFFRCESYPHKRPCIPKVWKCDGIVDCPSVVEQDERDCDASFNKDLENITPYNVVAALGRGRNWILNLRKNSTRSIQKWGGDLPKKVVALYLSNPAKKGDFPNELNYELSISFLSKLASKKIDDISTYELASYLNAFLVSCIDPKKFFGVDLIQELRKRVDAMNGTTSAFALLTLCNAKANITMSDVHKLLGVFLKAREQSKIDIQAYVIMAMSCAARRNVYRPKNSSDWTLHLKRNQQMNGIVHNIRTTALAMQALFAFEPLDDEDFDEKKAILQLLRNQEADGSFGGISNTYYILPVLAYSSLLNISDVQCPPPHPLEESEALENIRNQAGERKNIKYSLWIGDDRLIRRTLTLNVSASSSFYEIIEYAADLDFNYRYEYSMRNGGPHIYSISGITDDPEAETFWTPYQLVNEVTEEINVLNESPVNIFPSNNDHLVFWYKSDTSYN